jgi:hypothetical protein
LKARRTFNSQAALVEARAGRLTGAELRKAIKIVEELGKAQIAAEMRLYSVQPTSFAGDAAPAEGARASGSGRKCLKGNGRAVKPNHTYAAKVRRRGNIESDRQELRVF